MPLPNAGSYAECASWFEERFGNRGALITPMGDDRGAGSNQPQVVTHQFFVDNSEDEGDEWVLVSFVDLDTNRPWTFHLDKIEDAGDDRVLLTSVSGDQFLVSQNLTDQMRVAVAERNEGIW